MTAFSGSSNAAKAQLNIVLLIGLVLATALLLPLRGVEPVSAASEGDLDTSFDTDGWNTISGNDLWFEAMSVVVQSSGKTVIAGARMNGMQFDPLLARFNIDGSLDTSFGSDGTGIVVEPWPNGETIMEWVNRSGAAVDIALLSDDRIVMTSSPSGNDERHGIMLFNSNGVLDTSFSGDGRRKIASGGPNVDVWTTAVTATSDDKILIVGTSPDSSWDYRMKVYRLNTDGSLDTSFSNDGMRNINFPGGVDHLANAVVMAGDKTVVGGSAAASWQRHDMGIAQLKANGQNDLAGFADGAGKLYVDFGFGDSDVRELLVQADGKIVAIGESQVFDNDDSVAVVRLNADGSLDTSFSGDGKFAYDFGIGDSYGWAGALDADGQIVLAGQYNNGADDKPFVMRLTHDGELDTTFGTGGIRTYDFIGSNAESFNAIAVSGSAMVVAGGTGSSVLAARLLDMFETDPVLNITYDSQSGSVVSDGDSTTMTGGSINALPSEPTRAGYTFTGWYTAAQGGTKITSGVAHNQTNDFTLYAQWELAIAQECSNGDTLGMYQSITVNGVVTFKELDVDLGEYVDVPGVSLDLRPFGPWSDSVQINGAGVDPTSGKLFGAINDRTGLTSHIIQFDLTSPTPSVGFVGNFSSGSVWAADFLADGTFVFHDDVASVNKVRSISSLSGLPVFETRTEAPVLTPQTHLATVFENTGDITTVRQSDGTELLIGYDYPANKVAVVDASNLDSGALYTTTLPDGFDTYGYSDVVGAAWVTASGDAYFSLNSGDGIYAVFAEDLDTANQTAVLSATEVTSTQQTNKNDGFGCPTAADAPEEAGAASPDFTITYDAQGGAPTPSPTDCPSGTLTAITNDTPTLDNYLFANWNTAADGTGTTLNPGDWADCNAGDQTLYAQYSPETKNVAYDYNGASALSVSYVCFYGGTFVVDSDIPDYQGFNFVGWQDTATDVMYDPGDVVSCDDFSFLAIWEPITITFDPAGGTPDPFPTAECRGDGLFTVPGPPTRPGYDFVTWVGPEGQTASQYGLHSCDVTSWTAQWEAVNHTWTYDPDNGDPVETYSCPDQVDTTVNAAPTKEGFDFLRWSVVGEVSTGNANPGDVLPCVESMTFTAWWAATPDPEPDGDLDGDGVSDGDEEPGCEFDVDCDLDGLTDDLDTDDNDPDQDGDSILDGAENAGCITDPDPSCGETIEETLEENIDTTTTEPESVELPNTGTDQPKWPILLLIGVGSALMRISRRPKTSND